MEIVTATATSNEIGPLTKLVNEFCAIHGQLVAKGVSSPSDWEPMTRFVAVDEFKRVGAYLEELDWTGYLQFLTDWAGGTRFEMTEFHISEVGNAVFQEIEERHWHGEDFIRKNVIAVWRFNADRKIRHLDIYEQAKDSGRWIIEAAQDADSAATA